MHRQYRTRRQPHDAFSDATHDGMGQTGAPMRAEHNQRHLLVHCSLQNALEGMPHKHTQLHGMMRNLGGEKRLQSRIGLLTEIDDHVLCTIRRRGWSALWVQGVQEHEREVWMPQTLVHGVRRCLAWNDM